MQITEQQLKELLSEATAQAAKEGADIGFKNGVLAAVKAIEEIAEKFPEIESVCTALADVIRDVANRPRSSSGEA